jgi:hypothetical protein
MSVIRLVDDLTLRAVVDRGHGLTFECDNCWRLVGADVLALIGKYGPEATVGEVRRKLVCTRCHRRRARALLRTGDRNDDWFPTRPRGGR